MNKIWAALIVLAFFNSVAIAQTENPFEKKAFLSSEWTFSAFNNAIAMPFSGKAGIIHTPLHLGVAVGRNHYWNTDATHQLFQSFTAGVFYQQYVQSGIQLYSAFNYRYQSHFKLAAQAHLGVGYLHAIRDLQQFKLNDQQEYVKITNWGRPSLMIPFGLSLSYPINEHWKPFLGYQMWFQTPFSKEYIPVLPNTSLHLGVIYSKN